MAFETTVNVEYKHRDGWHVFTSQDALGLYVASKDARTAYEDVPGALKMLMELDYSCQCEVSRAIPFEQFAEKVLRGNDESTSPPELRNESLHVRGCRNDSVVGPL
ncbi:MAG TPA: hypothetical protein PLO65_08465 [Caulobacter sp.]|nr:hypothetical protein [Caulobacter sp.]